MLKSLKTTKFDVTFLGDDINIRSNGIFYATVGGMYGLQCNEIPDTKEYNNIAKQCDIIHKEILTLKELIDK